MDWQITMGAPDCPPPHYKTTNASHQWLSHIAILYRLIIVGLLLRSNSIEKASYAACSNLSAMHHPTAIQCIITCQCNAHCASSHQGTSAHVMHCTALETNRPMWQLRKSNHVILPTSNICEILLHRNLHQLDSLNQIRVEPLFNIPKLKSLPSLLNFEF